MQMWASNLRGAEDVVMTGLVEVVLADCKLADKVWQEIMLFLTNDSWLNCIDMRNSLLSEDVLRETVDMMTGNHSLLVLDLRGLPRSNLREKVYECCARNISESLPDPKTEEWYARFKEVLLDAQDNCYQTQFLLVPKETRDSLSRGSRSFNSTKGKSLDFTRSNLSTKVSSTPKTPKRPVRASHSLRRVTRGDCTCCEQCSKEKTDLRRKVEALQLENKELCEEVRSLMR